VAERVGMNSAAMRQANEAAALERIRRAGAGSKAELAQVLGLTPAAAGMIVSSLLQKGLLEPVGSGASRGGRRPDLFRLAARGLYAGGIDVDRGGFDVLLLDLAGQVAGLRRGELPEGAPFGAFAERAATALAELLKAADVPDGRLAGVGLSVPGYVDARSGRIIRAPNLGWHDEDAVGPLRRALAARAFGGAAPSCAYGAFSVRLENEAMAAAIGEHWAGACRDDEDFLCVNVRSGIGAGIFVHGSPYRGAGGIAGEIGHVAVDAEGPVCGCGRTGCLETRVATPRLLAALGVPYRPATAARDLLAALDASQSVRGDRGRRLAEETSHRLGVALAPLVNALNPSRIVLGRDLAVYGPRLLPGILAELRRDALAEAFAAVQVSITPLGGRASAVGAASIPLAGVFGRDREGPC
jgi:N-acetylglucosamine repressor